MLVDFFTPTLEEKLVVYLFRTFFRLAVGRHLLQIVFTEIIKSQVFYEFRS